MNLVKALLFTISAVGLLSSCSTARVSVLPGEDYNQIVSRDRELDGAEEAAFKAANEYCEKRGQSASFLGKENRYTGSMDEDNRKNIRNASKAAMMLGGAGAGYGQDGSPFGGVVGSAGAVGYQMTNDRDYKNEVRFRCR